MVAIWVEFQSVLRRHVHLMFILRSRDFALFRGGLGTLEQFRLIKVIE
jgi:hypothetical protein